MLVEIRTKQVESSEQVKNVLVADKLATCFGLNQNAIEFAWYVGWWSIVMAELWPANPT